MSSPATKRRTQAQRSEATQRELLRAAERLFAERGFREATLAEIAEAADVSKGAIYHHFSSKDELLLALVDEKLAERREALTAITAHSAGAPGRLVEEIPFDREWNLLFLEFVIRASRDPDFGRALRRSLSDFRKASAEAIAEVLENQQIESGFSREELARIVAGIGNGLAVEALLDPRAKTDPLYAEVLELLLEGLVARQRRR